jgi:hypothetical protein
MGLRGFLLVIAILPIWFVVMGVTLFILGLLMPPHPRPYRGPTKANALHNQTLGLTGSARAENPCELPSNRPKDQ